MPKTYHPGHGSKQFWPRHKSKKMTALVKSWVNTKTPKILGFAGYKAGMTHIMLKDLRPNSMYKNDTIVMPVTVIECPPLKIISLRLFKNSPYGHNVSLEIHNQKIDKNLSRKVSLPKKAKHELKDIESKINEFDDLRLLVYTQPKKSAIGKKKPEIFELGIGGKDIKEKFEIVKNFWEKEIKITDVFKQGIKVDTHSVTIGKGFQGVVKRFGVGLRSHKSEKKRRASVLGPESPGKVKWGTKMPGKMGFELRTEYNKDIILISDKAEKINPKGGFLHYGLIKGDYLLLKGSVAGPVKRLITFVEPQRKAKTFGSNYEIQYISQESKQ